MFFTHIISDTHFSHEKIISLGERPFSSVQEMNETLIENWNRVVPKDGVVLHLGDFAHDSVPREEIREIRNRLNGDIFLTLGNHDILENLLWDGTFAMNKVRFWFREEDKDVHFSHLPLEPRLLYSGRISVHGHTHGPISILDEELHKGSISVNCELHDYTPVSHDELMLMINERREMIPSSWAVHLRESGSYPYANNA